MNCLLWCFTLLLLLSACNLSSPEATPTSPTGEPTVDLTPQPTEADEAATVAPTRTPQDTPDNPTEAVTEDPLAGVVFPTLLPDSRTITITSGDTLIVNYTVEMDFPEEGEVFLRVTDPRGEVLFEDVRTVPGSDSARIEGTVDGEYRVSFATNRAEYQYALVVEEG